MSNPRIIWEALRKQDPPRAERPSGARRIFKDLYGAGRNGRPSTKAAAADLGVSQRTVQRWMREGLPAKSPAAQAATDKHQQWLATPEGRQAYVGPRRAQKFRGAKMVKLGGIITISGDERPPRFMDFKLDPGAMDHVIELLMLGDDAGAHDALEDYLSGELIGSVSLNLHTFELK